MPVYDPSWRWLLLLLSSRPFPISIIADTPFPDETIIGKRVLVPLGGRRVTGYVLGILPDEEVSYVLKPILEILDRNPLFHANLIPFFRWVARYYHFPIGEVIKTALPGGLTSGSEKKVVLTDTGREQWANRLNALPIEPVWWPDLLEKGCLSVAASRRIFGNKEQKKILASLVKLGYVDISEQLRKDGVKEKDEICYSLSSALQFPSDMTCYDEQIFNTIRGHLQEKLPVELKKSEIKTICFIGILGNISGNALVPQKELMKKYPGAAVVTSGTADEKADLSYGYQGFQESFRGSARPFSSPGDTYRRTGAGP